MLEVKSGRVLMVKSGRVLEVKSGRVSVVKSGRVSVVKSGRATLLLMRGRALNSGPGGPDPHWSHWSTLVNHWSHHWSNTGQTLGQEALIGPHWSTLVHTGQH